MKYSITFRNACIVLLISSLLGMLAGTIMQPEAFDTIYLRELVVVDDEDRARLTLSAKDGTGRIAVYNSESTRIVELAETSRMGHGIISTFRSDGSRGLSLASSPEGIAAIILFSSSGSPAVSINESMQHRGSGSMTMFNSNGTRIVALDGSMEGGGSLTLYNRDEEFARLWAKGLQGGELILKSGQGIVGEHLKGWKEIQLDPPKEFQLDLQ